MRDDKNNIVRQSLFRVLQITRTPAVLVVCRVGGAMLGMMTSLILSRHFGAASFGQISQAISLAMVLSIVCTLNIEAGSPRYMIASISNQKFNTARSFTQFSILVWVVMSAASCLCVWIWVYVFGNDISPILWGGILAAPVIGLTRIFAGFSMGFSKVYTAVVPRSFFRQFLFFMGVSIAISVFHVSSTIWVMLAFIGANIGVAAIQVWLIKPSVKNLFEQTPSQLVKYQDGPRWIAVGMIIGSSVLFVEFNQYLAILLAAINLSSVDVALLDIPLKIVGFMIFGVTAINQSYLPRVTQEFSSDNVGKLQLLFNQAAIMRICATGIIVIVSSILAPFILELFGPEFIAAKSVFYVLMGIPILMAICGPAQQILSLVDRPMILTQLVLVTIFILCCGVIIGSILWGVFGAAIGVLSAWVFWTISGAFFVYRSTGIHTSVFGIWQRR